MDGQEPQNTSGGASAAGVGPDHGYHRAAAVARPRSGRSAAGGAGAGRTYSPRRGSYRRGGPTADRRSNTGLRVGVAAKARRSRTGGQLDWRTPPGAAPDLPLASGAMRHGACRGGPDVRGAADDSLPGDGHGDQQGDQGPAGLGDPHRRTAGPADRGARRAGPRGRSRQAPLPGQRRSLVTVPAAGPHQARPHGRPGGARGDGRPERRGGPATPQSGTGRPPGRGAGRQDGPGTRPRCSGATTPRHHGPRGHVAARCAGGAPNWRVRGAYRPFPSGGKHLGGSLLSSRYAKWQV